MTDDQASEKPLDIREKGAPRDGQPQLMDRRLFMQLLVVDCRGDVGPTEVRRHLATALDRHGASAVIYEDVNHPTGLGVLSWSENPADFVDRVRPAFAAET